MTGERPGPDPADRLDGQVPAEDHAADARAGAADKHVVDAGDAADQLAADAGDDAADQLAADAGDGAAAEQPADAEPARSAGSRARRGATPSRSALVRLGVAALVAGGLIWWGTTGSAWGPTPDDGSPSAEDDGTAAVADRDALVRSAGLACPGQPEGRAAQVQARAAVAPNDLLDGLASGSEASGDADGEGGATGVGGEGGATGVGGEGGAIDAADEGGATAGDPESDDGSTAILRVGADGSATEDRRLVRDDVPRDLELRSGEGLVLVAGATTAPGLTASQLAVATEPGGRGAAFTVCNQPQDSQWLLAGGSGGGRAEELVLTNPGADPVQVDLDVRDLDGPAELTGGAGIVVPPQAQVVQLLDAVAPGVEAPAVHVTSTGGPVTAHLTDRYRDGTTDLGLDLTGAAATPGRDLVVPALPPSDDGGEERRTLRVVAPEAEALVELRALTTTGAVVPPTPALRVPAGATVELSLDDLPDDAVALRLRSDQPVTAAASLQVLPSGDEPILDDDASATTAPAEGTGDAGAATTSMPADADDPGTTAAPGEDAVSTAAPDDPSATTQAPDTGTDATAEPLLHPAGDVAWVPAVQLGAAPSAATLPEVGVLPDGRRSLVVTAVDATTAELIWLDQDGTTVSEDVALANDTSVPVEVPADAVAVWLRPADPAGPGVVAAVHVTGADSLGPYAGAASLPSVPWTRAITRIVPVVP